MIVDFQLSRIFFIRFDVWFRPVFESRLRVGFASCDQFEDPETSVRANGTLSFALRYLVGITVLAGQAMPTAPVRHHPFSLFPPAVFAYNQGIFDVLENRQDRDQVEVLED